MKMVSMLILGMILGSASLAIADDEFLPSNNSVIIHNLNESTEPQNNSDVSAEESVAPVGTGDVMTQ